MCVKMREWDNSGIPVKYIRCDNAGGNKSLEDWADNSYCKLGIYFYYTDCDTPHQNYLDELGFETIYNRGISIIRDDDIPIKISYNLFKEAFNTATFMDRLDVIDINDKNTLYTSIDLEETLPM